MREIGEKNLRVTIVTITMKKEPVIYVHIGRSVQVGGGQQLSLRSCRIVITTVIVIMSIKKYDLIIVADVGVGILS